MSSSPLSSNNPLVQPKQDQQVQTDIQKLNNRRPMRAKEAKPVQKSAGAFRTISEVADELAVEQHVLRFWETKFSQIKPLKRGGGRRYYRPEDVDLLKSIHNLLYSEGYTIKGVQKLLAATRGNLAGRAEPELASSPVEEAVGQNRDELKAMLDELKSMRKMID